MFFTAILFTTLNILGVIVVLAEETDTHNDLLTDKTEKPKLTPLKYFYFDVSINPESISTMQGKTVSIPIVVKLISGVPQEVKLTADKYSDVDIYTWFSDPFIFPPSSTPLFIETSCNTPEGQYLISVNGKSQEILRNGDNMLSFVVKPNPNCKSPPQNRDDPIALKNKASLLYERDKLNEAIRNYDKVLDIEPNDPIALKNKASILSELGMYRESILLCDKVLDIEPNDPIALRNKANALYGLKKYEDALSYYDKVLDIEPNDPIALKNKANLFYDVRKFELASMYYDNVLAIEPDNMIVLNNKASALYELGKFNEAMTYYDKILKIEPNNWIALNNKANTLYELGKYEESIIYYNKVLSIKPDEQRAITYKQLAIEKIGNEKSEYGGGCLIATATFGSELAPQIQFLREIRDNTVLSTASGASFMITFNAFYYSFSPTVADLERQNPLFKETVKVAITPLLSSLSLLQYVDIDSESEMLGYGISVILLNIGMYFVTPVILILKLKPILRTKLNQKSHGIDSSLWI